jgi:hypothetical protein
MRDLLSLWNYMILIIANVLIWFSNFILDNPQDFEKLKMMNIQNFFLNKGCVTLRPSCHLHTKVDILRQKKNDGNSNISPCKKKYSLHKKSFKRNQNPFKISWLHPWLISNFNTSQYIIFQKSSYKILDLLLPRGQNPLSYYILYNESKHNILAKFLVRQGRPINSTRWIYCKTSIDKHEASSRSYIFQ